MRHSPLRTRCFAFLAFSSIAAAQFTIEALSFGHLEDLSPNGQNIPGWSLAGEGHNPYIMSDRIVLTPPTPGNKRGGMWTEHPITYEEWEVVTEFRASGPERGSGNMQLWFSKDTTPMSAFRSVYTVDKFDGLVLQIDQYGGSGGKIRGFLNDGTTGYRNHHAVDSLAFGHCDYAYRNLGRMSKITLKQDHGGFQVFVDDKTCFSSSDIQLPTGYFFGVTAASAETPDSFEISKFVVSTTKSISREMPSRPRQPPAEQMVADAPISQEAVSAAVKALGLEHPTTPSSGGRFDSEQMAQILALLQTLKSSVAELKEEVVGIKTKVSAQGEEFIAAVVDVPTHFPYDSISEVKRRAETIEATVLRLRTDIEGRDYKEHLTGLQDALRDTRESLMSGLPQSMSQIITTSAPSLWLAIFVLIGFQLSLVGAYVIYKRRRANSPKKLL